ncbi:hypothetical protein FS749_011484, partial [Ceratobasidium sp. UAMH 11750]
RNDIHLPDMFRWYERSGLMAILGFGAPTGSLLPGEKNLPHFPERLIFGVMVSWIIVQMNISPLQGVRCIV